MALEDIFKPKSDNEIYDILKITQEPTFELFGLIYKKPHLLARLLADNEADEEIRTRWQNLLLELRDSINRILENQEL
ncbi:MAG: hypothetical protein GT597_00995 [Bacteroidales bacterium]|jgi:hypothetical protein|nr:hypothetical protein [Bacteroidales bacterium]HNY52959.1 hypothetical protein [Bacteroidales bacterium]HQB86392.1 hypothetical protein [Bacteroidales bacterium]